MKPGAGSKKGPPFERDICRQLSIWWTRDDKDGSKDGIFWRSPGSGAVATWRAKSGKKTDFMDEDVSLLNPVGEAFLKTCVVEIKRGYSAGKSSRFDVLTIVDTKSLSKGIFFNFWIKLSEKAYDLHKNPLLIFRRDRKYSCVCCRPSLVKILEKDSGVYRGICIGVSDDRSKMLSHGFRIMALEGFLDWANPATFKRLV